MGSLLIRADGGPSIGVGHLMRMLSLAQSWKRRGREAAFACCECPGGVEERLDAAGVKLIRLENHSAGSDEDSRETLDLALSLEADWIALDGYGFDVSYQRRLRHPSHRVLAVDDYQHTSPWAVDKVLNPNLYARDLDYQGDDEPLETLLGPQFGLLREEFRDGQRKEWPAEIRRLLITLGGSDRRNITGAILAALEEAGHPGLEIRVLIGAANPNREELMKAVGRSSCEVDLQHDVEDMVSCYQWADAVVSAGGGTCYEWMLFGLPALVVLTAENQRRSVAKMTQLGLAMELPNPREQEREAVQALRAFLQREERTPPESWPVDALGPDRVVAAMLGDT